jgi:hypothetical protein
MFMLTPLILLSLSVSSYTYWKVVVFSSPIFSNISISASNTIKSYLGRASNIYYTFDPYFSSRTWLMISFVTLTSWSYTSCGVLYLMFICSLVRALFIRSKAILMSPLIFDTFIAISFIAFSSMRSKKMSFIWCSFVGNLENFLFVFSSKMHMI